MKNRLLSLEIRFEHDVVQVRQRARQLAALLGFELQDQTRIATAVSEMARNTFQYARAGQVEFTLLEGTDEQSLSIRIEDQGPGIANLAEILAGQYVSSTGMGLGLLGARRLMDSCDIESTVGKGTMVLLGKRLTRSLRAGDVARIAQGLAARPPESPFEEIQRQNQELLRAMDTLRSREIELARTNDILVTTNLELEETNRGVLVLYAELDDKAAELRRANELKTRFLSYMSHEFRTPLNSIRGLSQLLLDRVDGELTAEQEKQVGFIQQAAVELSDLVNDLLDVAKVEAGKVVVQPSEFHVSELFGSLKGMFRPLHTNPDVALLIEPPAQDYLLRTDEAKLAQILRNFISNALKFTERGHIRVAAHEGVGSKVVFTVTDTGIGIAPADQQKIFEEFSQLDSSIQRRVKGTGLGLSLTRKLAQLLGGNVEVQSELGHGSRFSVTIPRRYAEAVDAPIAPAMSSEGESRSVELVLIIDDEAMSRYLLRTVLPPGEYEVIEAAGGNEGIRLAKERRPDVIFLDFFMPDMDAFGVLEALRAHPDTRDINVIINTSKVLTAAEHWRLSQLTTAIISKETTPRERAQRDIAEALEKVRLLSAVK